jgi:hypothetical protein
MIHCPDNPVNSFNMECYKMSMAFNNETGYYLANHENGYGVFSHENGEMVFFTESYRKALSRVNRFNKKRH